MAQSYEMITDDTDAMLEFLGALRTEISGKRVRVLGVSNHLVTPGLYEVTVRVETMNPLAIAEPLKAAEMFHDARR